MSNIKNYTKSDLKLIHLLASRGLDYEKSITLVNSEKELNHTRKNLNKIMDLFCIVTDLTLQDFIIKRDRRTQHFKHVFLYYCSEYTDLTHEQIASFLKLEKSNVYRARKVIINDIDVNESLTTDTLFKINKLISKTRIRK